DGALFASGREANVSQTGDIYRLSTTGTAIRVGSTGVGAVGDLDFAPIAEPTTLLLLGSGLAVVGAAKRKRRIESREAVRPLGVQEVPSSNLGGTAKTLQRLTKDELRGSRASC